MARLDDALRGTGKVMILKRIPRTRDRAPQTDRPCQTNIPTMCAILLISLDEKMLCIKGIYMVGTSMPSLNEPVLQD